MTIEKKQNGNEMTLELKGWLDTQSSSELESAIDSLDPNIEQLIMDLSSLEYIASSGLRQLVAAHKKMKGNLTLTHVSPEIMDVIGMTGLDKRLHIE